MSALTENTDDLYRRDHGLLMKPDLVAKTLAGEKWITRRLVTRMTSIVNGYSQASAEFWARHDLSRAWVDPGPSPAGNPGPYLQVPCDIGDDEAIHRVYPKWQKGDRIWVKEPWRPRIAHSHGEDACDCADVTIRYSDGSEKFFDERDIPDEWTLPKAARNGTVSSLLLPKWAARVWLEVVSVRPERLQDITEEDAKAEGVTIRHDEDCWSGSYRLAFEYLWGEINGWDGQPGARAPWSSNPLVWVVSFRRLP